MSAKRHRDSKPNAVPEKPLEPAAEVASPADAAPAAALPEELAASAEGASAAGEAEAGAELAALSQDRERLLRLLADRDNQVKRMEREQEREAQRLRGDLALLLLPVLDDLERALAQLPADEDAAHGDGLRLIARRFQEQLAAFGLTPIAALGERFDPRCHEALVQLPATEAEKGTVIQELQKGYRLGELLIRPAKVAVAG